MTTHTPTILIIVGITGDLATRKILPAILEIKEKGALPEKLHIVGITRKPHISIESLFSDGVVPEFFKKSLSLFQMDIDMREEYARLGEYLADIENTFGSSAERLFYLSVPPEISHSLIQQIGLSGLAEKPGTKLLLEKPFGTSLENARILIEEINAYFKPEQVYRIDHYLAKEMSQNLIIFREDNSLFRRTWNSNFIEQIDIIANEAIGILGRVSFYEQTGALRDIIQSHLLQLAALALMDLGTSSKDDDIPSRRLRALKDLEVATPLEENIIRGQYRGYRADVNNDLSNVETFVSIKLHSRSERWSGVPITLSAGKMLDKKSTEIHIYYKKDQSRESNELILRLQPNEGVHIGLWSKRPGYEKQIEKHTLDFTYKDYYSKLPEAYEQVLLDAMHSNHSLFTSSEEILEEWRIINPIQEAWNKSEKDLKIYEADSTSRDISHLLRPVDE